MRDSWDFGLKSFIVLSTLALAACTGEGEDAGDDATESASSTNASSVTVSGSSSSSTTGMSMGGTETTTAGTMSASDSMGTTDATTTAGTEVSTTEVSSTDATDATTEGTTTETAECGNGVQEPGEQCDDGNGDPGDGCEPDCTLTPSECGNGIQEPGEQCDDGNDVNGDGCENNCTNTPPPACVNEETAVKCDANVTEWYKAIEIGCSADPNETVVITDQNLASNNPNAWRIAKGFGTYHQNNDPNMPLLYSPRGGESFLMVSTGVIAQPDGMGVVIENNNQDGNGDNGNDDSNSLPAPMSANKGSNNGQGGTPFMNCDGVNDCSDSLYDAWNLGTGDPNDKLTFTFKAMVPDNVESYSFNFAYFSSEWPTWVDTVFNDLFIAWQVSEAYTGNVTFIGDAPLTVTSLDPYLSTDGYSNNEPQLQGTGFTGHAGSDWFGANQNVVGGEVLWMTFMIADMGDSILATMTIVDNFHWNCEACIPADDPKCTGEVPDPNCCGVIEPQ
ncbi:MAG: choice-of-anchor L domain-containing protein [Nannocystaceae bacterium]